MNGMLLLHYLKCQTALMGLLIQTFLLKTIFVLSRVLKPFYKSIAVSLFYSLIKNSYNVLFIPAQFCFHYI